MIVKKTINKIPIALFFGDSIIGFSSLYKSNTTPLNPNPVTSLHTTSFSFSLILNKCSVPRIECFSETISLLTLIVSFPKTELNNSILLFSKCTVVYLISIFLIGYNG